MAELNQRITDFVADLLESDYPDEAIVTAFVAQTCSLILNAYTTAAERASGTQITIDREERLSRLMHDTAMRQIIEWQREDDRVN